MAVIPCSPGGAMVPVVKSRTLRIFLVISALQRRRMYRLVVESAFIFFRLNEEVYMHPHPTMNVPRGHIIGMLRSQCGTIICTALSSRWDLSLLTGSPSSSPYRYWVDRSSNYYFVNDILVASDNDAAVTRVIKDNISMAECFLTFAPPTPEPNHSEPGTLYSRTTPEVLVVHIGTR